MAAAHLQLAEFVVHCTLCSYPFTTLANNGIALQQVYIPQSVSLGLYRIAYSRLDSEFTLIPNHGQKLALRPSLPSLDFVHVLALFFGVRSGESGCTGS